MQLILLKDTYAICRLAAGTPLPMWSEQGQFVSVTRTNDELSIVCREAVVPQTIRSEKGWRCARVAGTLDFALVGVLVALVEPLAAAGISVFCVSTFDTDYLLVPGQHWPAARTAWEKAGHHVVTQD